MRKTADEWMGSAPPRKDVIKQFEREAKKLAEKGDTRRILFSFLSDPYQPAERKYRLTQQALEIVGKYKLNCQILTKGAPDLIMEDLPLIREVGAWLGMTVCFVDDTLRQAWEPNASLISDRFYILEEAHNRGIYTWVSLEPVIDPTQALGVIERAHSFVNYWKVGKLNHMKEQEAKVDWRKFHQDVTALLHSVNASFYIKNDLLAVGSRIK